MKNFTSFIMAFLHLEFNPIISCKVGTFKAFSASDVIFEVAELSIRTNLLGLNFFHLLQVIMLLGVLTRNGAVINLYAEASKPSFLGAASGVIATSDCSTKASSFNYIYRLESAK